MQELIKKYEISDVFYKRYFEQNAINKLSMSMLKFMWFKEGTFLNPMKKNEHLQNFIKEEVDNFFNKKQLNIPQIEFCITTKCTLRCKDCCALIPDLDTKKRSEMNFENFKKQLDNLLNAVDSIRHLVILGGEPLLNPDLPQMLEYAANQEKIFFIQLISNGTMLPSKKLLDVMSNYNNRIYLYMSNYSDNPELTPILKQEAIKELLKEHNIKLQKPENWAWLEERTFRNCAFEEDVTKAKFLDCYRTKCNQIMNDRLDICSKATAGRELKMFEDDSIDLNSKTLREDLIEFYQKPYMNACKYCIITQNEVQPALQL